jgi:hypothetical protein
MKGNGMHGYRIPNAKLKSTLTKHTALLGRLVCRRVLGVQELAGWHVPNKLRRQRVGYRLRPALGKIFRVRR